MRTIPEGLEQHLQQEVLQLATCWKLTRRDGVVLGFTDHDADLMLAGVEYVAHTGFTPSAVAATSNLSVDNLDVEGLLDATSIREADILAGRYDFAQIEVFQVNYSAPKDGAMILRRGWLGEISLRQNRFVAEVRGLSQKLSQQIGALYSPACRAALGDGQCKVALATFTQSGAVQEADSRTIWSDTAREEQNGYFAGGKITFTSGANSGLSMEVKAFAEGQFTLVLPMPYDIAAGDGYVAVAGCDKNFATCCERFNNALNFRGEPHVPGMDRMLETSATRSQW